MKVQFRDLSVPLKLAIIGAWTYIIIFGAAFLVGFIDGLINAY